VSCRIVESSEDRQRRSHDNFQPDEDQRNADQNQNCGSLGKGSPSISVGTKFVIVVRLAQKSTANVVLKSLNKKYFVNKTDSQDCDALLLAKHCEGHKQQTEGITKTLLHKI
jgi:hypothetical protein